jgi:hypothetical protein
MAVMPLDSQAVPIRITLPTDQRKPCVVEVDGADIAAQIDGLRLDVAGNQPAMLTLYGPVAGTIVGDAVVRVMVDSDPRQVLADLIGTVDPAQLEQAALQRLDYDDSIDHGLTAAMLRELLGRLGHA